MDRRGHHGLVENFLFHSAEKIRRGTLLCFKNFWYRRCSCIGKGASVFRRKFSVSQDQNEKLRSGTFCVSEIFWYGKKFWTSEVYHDFVELLCLTVPKYFEGKPFLVSEKL